MSNKHKKPQPPIMQAKPPELRPQDLQNLIVAARMTLSNLPTQQGAVVLQSIANVEAVLSAHKPAEEPAEIPQAEAPKV